MLGETADAAPGPGQVLVRMRAASLNYRDLMVATGRYARGAPLPDLVPLSDGAGEVAEIGPGVTRVKPGDRVAGIFMQTWLGGEIEPEYAASSLGGAIHGVLAEYAVFSQDGLVQLPEHLSFEEGATLPCAARHRVERAVRRPAAARRRRACWCWAPAAFRSSRCSWRMRRGRG